MFLNEKKNYRISAISLGFTAVITQIIVIREFLSVFSSNEPVIGIIFSNWMLLTGLGAYLGKFNILKNKNLLAVFQFLTGAIPLITVFLISALRNRIFTPGRMLSPFEIYYSSFVLLIPFCILTGFLFTIISKNFSGLLKSNRISNIYSLESLGSIIGGLLFNFLFLFVFSTFNSLKILFIINSLISVLFLFVFKKKNAGIITSIAVSVLVFLIIPKNFDKKALEYLYPNQEILEYSETPFGKIIVTKTSDQLNFYENGTTLFSTGDVIKNEEDIHYAMVQNPGNKNILLVSGGISGTVKEILKYDINSLDYVEINPWLIKTGNRFTKNIEENQKVRIINKDARLFLKSTGKKYDVVIINLPSPSNIEINRYYTLDFFKDVKNNMTKKGVLSVSLPPTTNYAGAESVNIQSVIFSTLSRVFTNIIIIPGGKNYFLASDGMLSYKIAELIESRQIKTDYVNKYYIDDVQNMTRGKRLTEELNKNAEVNKDFKPVASFLQWKYWLAHFNITGNIWIFILTIPVLISVLRMNLINTALFTTGLTSISTEIILIISFQILYGYIYQMTGIFITFFMIGLAFGSFRFYKIFDTTIKDYSFIQFTFGIYTLLTAFVIFLLNLLSANSIIVHIVFLIMIFISGTLTGTQFSLATKLTGGSIAKISADSYSSEITGSAFGALIVSAVLIPVLGIFITCILIGVLNLIVASFIFLKSKLY